MKCTIVINRKRKEGLIQVNREERELYFADSESDAFIYHIEHPAADSYMVYSQGLSPSEIRLIIQHIHYLDPMIPVLIVGAAAFDSSEFRNNKNIYLVEKNQEISAVLKDLPENHRSGNRAEWPVNVDYSIQKEPGIKHGGIILSISSTGCFARTKNVPENGETLELTIRFRDFNFFTEGVVVRINMGKNLQPDGFAAEFHNTSLQTKKCIQDIINEKILSGLMDKLNPDEGGPD